MEIYNDLFTCWNDVRREFACDEPEPDEVVTASYSYEDYSGRAWVVYRNGDKFFEVEGGHCSCYGLEDQWKPEEYEPSVFLEALFRRSKERSFLENWPGLVDVSSRVSEYINNK